MRRLGVFMIPLFILVAAYAVGRAEINGSRHAELQRPINFPSFSPTDSTETVEILGPWKEGTFIWYVDLTDTVLVYCEGSLNGEQWANLDSDGPMTLTTDGVYGYRYGGLASVRYLRIRATGDTTATITSSLMIGGAR